MNYIDISEIQDKFLQITDNDVLLANAYVDSIAKRKGVSVDKIACPLSYSVKRLAMCYACYNNCLACVGTDPTTTFDGGSRQDMYAQKLEFYKKEIDFIESMLTETDFTGKKASGNNIGLWRA